MVENTLRSKELMPSNEEDRALSFLDYTLLWAGMTINIAGFAVGAQLYPDMSPSRIIMGIIVAYGIVTILLALTGDIGMRYGIPFIVYARACFGYKGSSIAGLIRSIPCLFWFGFQTWVGAIALNEILVMATGYSNVTLLIILFATLQVINALFGLKAMAKFDWIAIPLLAVVLGMMMFWLLGEYQVTIPDLLSIQSDNSISFAFAVTGIAGGWITMTLNAPDLTRELKRNKNYMEQTFFERNKIAILGQILGLIIVGTLVLVVGMTSGILTGIWNPVDVIAEAFASNKIVLVFCFLTIVLAQWSTNTTSNLMPPANILLNLFPKLKFWMTTIISGILGLIIMPWRFSDYLVEFQALSSSLLGPIVGIMLADYYIIRKQVINVNDLYVENGQYTYKNGYNISAILTLVISFIIGLLTGDYAFFTGLIVSIVLYTILMKKITLIKYEQNLGKYIPFEDN